MRGVTYKGKPLVKNNVYNILKNEKYLGVYKHSAIEQGVVSNTTKKRLQELEARQQEIEKLILIEKSKTAVTITEKEIREFYAQALRGDPQMQNYLIKEIVLYDDKIVIYYNSPIKISPDDSQGFSFCHKTVMFYNVITQLIMLIK